MYICMCVCVCVCVDIRSQFNSRKTFEGNLMPKLSLLKNSSGSIKLKPWGYKSIHSFPQSISRKENIIVQPEFELV